MIALVLFVAVVVWLLSTKRGLAMLDFTIDAIAGRDARKADARARYDNRVRMQRRD